MTPLSVILAKRDNDRPHTREEIDYFVDAFVRGDVKDYQMAAWMMAVCLNGMTATETAHLTSAMVRSGEVLDWAAAEGGGGGGGASPSSSVDKHSTGGVGDKVSLVLAPLAASFDGVRVPMMAGRGLGHTGGTIDKLESIPGFRTDLSSEEFREVVSRVGGAIVSPGRSMVPADRRMYALRDVTGTVTSPPLQTGSIMSKKLAENPDSLVLDVKFGRGTFQRTAGDSIELAKSLIAAGEGGGKTTSAFVTRMDCPLGAAVGNWLEVKECIQILRSGEGAEDLVDLCVVEAAQMLLQSGVVPSGTLEEGIRMARDHLGNGKALAKFREMVIAQGGDVGVVDNVESYPGAKFEAEVCACSAEGSSYVEDVNALEVGYAAIDVRAGRKTSEDEIDFTAGIWFHKKVGDAIDEGGKVATVYGNDEASVQAAADRVGRAIKYSSRQVEVPPLVTHFVTKDSVEEFDMGLLR